MTKLIKPYDVIVVGNGITGLSTVLHLEQAGIANIALCATNSQPLLRKKTAGIVTGGQIDNFTRFSHNYGNEFAKQLWDFGNKASDHIVRYCQKNSVGVETGPRLRLITSSAEMREAAIAVKQMQEAGFAATLHERVDYGYSFTERVVAIQDDGHAGSIINVDELGSSLSKQIKAKKIQPLKRFEKDGTVFRVHSGNQVVETQMLVFACHLAIGEFLPEIKEALVSIADQWGYLNIENTTKRPARLKTFVYTANHTYEWGSLSEARATLGGGRYLRHHAGIEATTAPYEKKIEEHLRQQFSLTMPNIKLGKVISGTAGLDCRPCDELPIIGPMFGESRLLVATGYMGNGLALGFYAGKCLTEFILKGRADICPRRLHPERLRSLER
jgi:glycine/D-amino acid oxidase-like deaminating enzyme